MCPNCDTFCHKMGITQKKGAEILINRTISMIAVSCRKLEDVTFDGQSNAQALETKFLHFIEYFNHDRLATKKTVCNFQSERLQEI